MMGEKAKGMWTDGRVEGCDEAGSFKQSFIAWMSK